MQTSQHWGGLGKLSLEIMLDSKPVVMTRMLQPDPISEIYDEANGGLSKTIRQLRHRPRCRCRGTLESGALPCNPRLKNGSFPTHLQPARSRQLRVALARWWAREIAGNQQAARKSQTCLVVPEHAVITPAEWTAPRAECHGSFDSDIHGQNR